MAAIVASGAEYDIISVVPVGETAGHIGSCMTTLQREDHRKESHRPFLRSSVQANVDGHALLQTSVHNVTTIACSTKRTNRQRVCNNASKLSFVTELACI